MPRPGLALAFERAARERQHLTLIDADFADMQRRRLAEPRFLAQQFECEPVAKQAKRVADASYFVGDTLDRGLGRRRERVDPPAQRAE